MTVGDVVLVRFPFSDLTSVKLRPAVVLASAQRGSLNRLSFVRPAKLFTANRTVILRSVENLTASKAAEIREAVIDLFKQPI